MLDPQQTPSMEVAGGVLPLSQDLLVTCPGPMSEVFSFLSESTTYTGDMDLRDFNLATLFRIMNYSREILIEDDLFNRIEEFLRNILMANPAEEIFNFLERIEGGSNMILSNKGLSLSFASSRSASILLLVNNVNIYDK